MTIAIVRSLVTGDLSSDDRERIMGTLEGARDLIPSEIMEDMFRAARAIGNRADALAFLELFRVVVGKKLEPTKKEREYLARKAARRAARNRPIPNITTTEG